MPVLPDGTVLPHHLGVTSTPRMSDGNAFGNVLLRLGEVQDVLAPDDDRNRSKKFTEYRVLVQQRSGDTGNAKIYENCVLANFLGGIADVCEYTLRADSSQNRDKFGLAKGSKVLMLCVNGEATTAVILSGVRDQTDSDADNDLGHHFRFRFNGISATISDDGSFKLAYGGKSKIGGGLDDSVDSDSTGSYVELDAKGNLKLSDKDGKNAVVVDHADGKVKIARDQAFELGEATDKMLLGESFRREQQTLHNKLRGYLQGAATTLTTAGGKVAGPFMAAAAGADLIAAAQLIQQAAQALADFEQNAAAKNSYLSRKNSSD